VKNKAIKSFFYYMFLYIAAHNILEFEALKTDQNKT